MTNFINCENEFLSLSMEISGKRAHIFLMCSKLFSAILLKKKFHESEYERFLATPVFGFCQRQMMWAPTRTTPVEQVPPPVQLCTPISADQQQISQKLRPFSCGMYLFYDNHYFR